MQVQSLGYVRITSEDPHAWTGFACDVLGMQAVAGDNGTLHLRMDARHHRLAVEPGDADGGAAYGWEVADVARWRCATSGPPRRPGWPTSCSRWRASWNATTSPSSRLLGAGPCGRCSPDSGGGWAWPASSGRRTPTTRRWWPPPPPGPGCRGSRSGRRPPGWLRRALPARAGSSRLPRGRLDLAPAELVAELGRFGESNGGGNGALVLVNRRLSRQSNSVLRHSPRQRARPPHPTLLMHPEDAARLGLADGDRVSVSSASGETAADVEVTEAIRPGVVSLPHAWHTPGVNRLTSASGDVDTLTGMPRFSGLAVTVRAGAGG